MELKQYFWNKTQFSFLNNKYLYVSTMVRSLVLGIKTQNDTVLKLVILMVLLCYTKYVCELLRFYERLYDILKSLSPIFGIFLLLNGTQCSETKKEQPRIAC